MQKLIQKFQSNPNIDNCVKVLRYRRKHPMAAAIRGNEIKEAEEFFNKFMGR